MTEKEVNEYLDFMYNPKNSYNCDKCPENSGLMVGKTNSHAVSKIVG